MISEDLRYMGFGSTDATVAQDAKRLARTVASRADCGKGTAPGDVIGTVLSMRLWSDEGGVTRSAALKYGSLLLGRVKSNHPELAGSITTIIRN